MIKVSKLWQNLDFCVNYPQGNKMQLIFCYKSMKLSTSVLKWRFEKDPVW